MNEHRFSTHHARTRVAGIALAVALAVPVFPSALLAQDETPSPEPTTSAEAACDSASDLRLIVDFLREVDREEDGLVPVLVGVIAGISEGRQLIGLVGETYRPLVEDLVVSFQDLRVTLEDLGEQDTVGAGVETVGLAIADIGVAMDELAVQLREPCPEDE